MLPAGPFETLGKPANKCTRLAIPRLGVLQVFLGSARAERVRRPADQGVFLAAGR
jgi:hypothetical protein